MLLLRKKCHKSSASTVSQFSVFLSMFAASPLPGPVHFNLCSWQVARILEVSEEMRKNMGVNSGLELITLPYGHQLRLDIIERWVVLLCTTVLSTPQAVRATVFRAGRRQVPSGPGPPHSRKCGPWRPFPEAVTREFLEKLRWQRGSQGTDSTFATLLHGQMEKPAEAQP